jgi:transposase
VLSWPSTMRIHVGTSPVDMRKSFTGLAAVTRTVLGRDPLSGEVFVYFNRRGDIAKVLWWSHGGFCLFCKRLEKSRFRLTKVVEHGEKEVEVEATELAMLLDGLELSAVERRPRWSPSSESSNKIDELRTGLERELAQLVPM